MEMTREQGLATVEKCIVKLRQRGEGWHAGQLARVRKAMVEMFEEQDKLLHEALAIVEAKVVTPGVTPHVVVRVEGGVVVDVISTAPMEYTVIDYDTESADDEDLVDVPQPDGTADEEALGHTSPCTVNPEWVPRVAALMRRL